MSTAPRPTSSGPIRSEFANDPDMLEIVEMYVQEMPERIAQVQQFWSAQQLDELKRLAHQLKGASGGYGFPGVGKAAGNVENTLTNLCNGSSQSSLLQLRDQVEELVNMCQRVSL